MEFCLQLGLSPLSQATDGQTPIDLCATNGTPEIAKLLEQFAAVPAEVVTEMKAVTQNGKTTLSFTLPSPVLNHPLFTYLVFDFTYKKNAFLASTQSKTIDLVAYFKEHTSEEGVVEVVLEDLSEGSSYQVKTRLTNRNGAGPWSSPQEFKVEEEEKEEEEESEEEEEEKEEEEKEEKKSEGRKKHRHRKRRSHHRKQESEEEEQEEEEEEKEKEKEEEKEEEEEEKEEEEKEEEKAASSIPLQTPVETTKNTEVSETPAKVDNMDKTDKTEKALSEVTPVSTPTPTPAPTPEPEVIDIRKWVKEGESEKLKTVGAEELRGWVSEEGLPALHACILECQDSQKARASVRVLIEKGCSLTQEVTCVC